MNKEELNEWIEQYLDGTLSDTERQEVEHKLATDPDFRAEVGLHRAMHTSLGDQGKHRLRAALDRLLLDPPIVETPFPDDKDVPRSTSPNWLRLSLLIAALVLTGLVLWRLLASSDEKHMNDSKSIQQQDTITPIKSLDTVSIPIKEIRNKEIAMADPKDFVPNPMLEARVGDLLRGGNITFELTSPNSGETLQLQNGQLTLLIQGIVSGGEIPTDRPLALLIYSNRPEDWTENKPIKTFSLPLTSLEEGRYRVDFRPKLRVRPGLFYLVVGQKRLPELGDGHTPLWIDKFVVREKQ